MDYEPIARLGRGGMGVVDLARDANGQRVAIKRLTLHGSASDIQRARQRLLREAGVLSRLHHPNIVRLIEVTEEDDEILLVMPYLNGGNLAERVNQHGPAPPNEVERLAQRLLGALATAHANGIIHRDLKPANVLFDEQGEPCLADFGVAQTWDQTQGLTVTGMVVGTPGFMGPEQARDEPLTPASDIFSLGATLLFAATGIGPYGSGDPGLLMVRAAEGKVERLPRSLPAGLRRRLRPMLHPNPNRRPTAAGLLTGDHSALRRTPPLGHTRGNVRAAVFAAFAASVLVAGAVVSAGRDDSGGEASGGPATSKTDEVLPDPGDGTELANGEAEELTLEAEGPPHLLNLPMTVGDCPAEVVLTLQGSPGAEIVVRVIRSVSDKPDDDPTVQGTSSDGQAQAIPFHPEPCDDPRVSYSAEVSVTSGGVADPVAYRIARSDS